MTTPAPALSPSLSPSLSIETRAGLIEDTDNRFLGRAVFADLAHSTEETSDLVALSLGLDPTDLAHDAHVNIVTFQPGGVIPFEETHVMEHGLYVLQGKAVYRLNRDWVEVEAGDFMWLRAYGPQACYAAGPGPFRYLLYKDVNRHMKLKGPFTN